MHDFLRLLLSLVAGWNLSFCEHVCVACVYRLFFVRSSVFRGFIVRFPHVLQAFTICMLHVQRSFCAGVCTGRKWTRNLLIKGVAFGFTQSGGTPRFCTLAITLKSVRRTSFIVFFINLVNLKAV